MDRYPRLKPKRVEWHAIVTHADGTVEDLGIVSAQYKNPLRQLAYRVKRKLGKV